MYSDNTKKFDGRAKNYALARPGYSNELIDCLYERYGLANSNKIADIGSGTGKFSKYPIERQNEVYCVEPNDDMRKEAEKCFLGCRNFHSIKGTAEDTTLDSCSVDCVTVAQAFHWFDASKFKSECMRILKDNGNVILVWNSRTEDNPVNREWAKVYEKFCPNFKGFSNGIIQNDIGIKNFFKEYEQISFDYCLQFDRENFIKRSLSSSYSLKESDKNCKEYVNALNELFAKYETGGEIKISNRSTAYIGKIK